MSRHSFKQLYKITLVRPSIVVALAYIVFIVVLSIVHHHSVLAYVHLGSYFSRYHMQGWGGYDGQFYYQIARDPFGAYHLMDNAPYRYQRIVYPLLVRLLSLGQVAVIPYMLLGVSFVAIVLSVEMLARLLSKYGLSPWFSVALGLYFGQAAGFIFDTTEPLTYALICASVWLLEKERLTWAAVFLGLAALSREIAILFTIGYIVYFVAHKRWKDVARFSLLAVAPLLGWYVLLGIIFGGTGIGYAPPFERIPFGGIFFFFSHKPVLFWQLMVLMFLPTMGNWLLVGVELARRRWGCMLLIWLLNLLLLTFLAHASYEELVTCGHIAIGMVLACLLYGLKTRNTFVLKVAQCYTVTFPLYMVGVISGFVPG